MPSLLHNKPITDQQRRRNDRHSLATVIAVVAVLAVYAYLFTHSARWLNLPQPQKALERFGYSIEHVFDDDRNVDCAITVTQVQSFETNDDERLVLFAIVLVAFVSSYFLKLPYKQPALVLWTLIGIGILYGPKATAGLLFAHLVVYLTLHPVRRGILAYASLLATAAQVAFFPHCLANTWSLGCLLALVGGIAVFYRWGLLPLLDRPRIGPVLRTIAVQSAMLTVCVCALAEGLGAKQWRLALGVLLFFWQWERLILYHIDYKDGQVPSDLSLGRYLAVFFSPGVIPSWTWGVATAQGFAYVNNSFLCEDKNTLVRSGLTLWGFALIYLVFGDWIRYALVGLFENAGVPVHRARITNMVEHFMAGGQVSTPTVLATTMLDLFRWLFLWGGVVHFKVGVWRVCGYRIDAYFDKPWLSTNLVTFWSRFTFHYREFLVRAFYYPTFFRLSKWNRNLRIFAATMAAACVGNLTWGHISERLFYRGLQLEHIVYMFRIWPYFFLLGLSISLSQLYLLKKKRKRKPWTRGWAIAGDVVAAYATLQFYALIIIFARPRAGATEWDLLRLFAKGFGITL